LKNSLKSGSVQAVPLFLKVVTIVWGSAAIATATATAAVAADDNDRDDDSVTEEDEDDDDVDPSTGKPLKGRSLAKTARTTTGKTSKKGGGGKPAVASVSSANGVNSLGLSAEVILQEYAYAWRRLHAARLDGYLDEAEEEKEVSALRQHAAATADVLCSINKQVTKTHNSRLTMQLTDTRQFSAAGGKAEYYTNGSLEHDSNG
jgi:hypothetical protein